MHFLADSAPDSFSVCPGQTPHRMALWKQGYVSVDLWWVNVGDFCETKDPPRDRSQESAHHRDTLEGRQASPQAEQLAAAVPLTDRAGCCGCGISGRLVDLLLVGSM